MEVRLLESVILPFSLPNELLVLVHSQPEGGPGDYFVRRLPIDLPGVTEFLG